MDKIINCELVWTKEDAKKHYEQYDKDYLIDEIIRLRLELQNINELVLPFQCATDRLKMLKNLRDKRNESY